MSVAVDHPLLKEHRFFMSHLPELAERYDGKVVVIKDERVIGVYASDLAAVQATQKQHPLGTFLVNRVNADPESYTQKFHSRVAVPVNVI